MPIYLFNIFYVRYCILFGLLLRSLSRMWQKRCCFCIWLGELCCFLFEMPIFQSLEWRQIVQLRKVTLVQIVVWPPWVQSKGYTKEGPMCCKRIYDAPVEMNDTSPTIKISLVSLQKNYPAKWTEGLILRQELLQYLSSCTEKAWLSHFGSWQFYFIFLKKGILKINQ